jgi:general secretion pathway protein F
LPGLTVFLIGLSDFLRAYGLVLVVAVIGLGFAAGRALRREGPRRWRDALLLRIPLIAKLVRGSNTARFTRTLSILTGSGVPVLEALRISAEVVTNVPMREAVDKAAARVREGGPIGKSLAVGGFFPPLIVHLISSGEASGELETMLARAATNQEREMNGLIAVMLGILQPALIVTMGIIVLVIVLAILLPIFELNQLVG